MIWLVLSVICSVLIVALFKVFEKRALSTYQLIVFNYFFCALCGTLFNVFNWPLVFVKHFTEWGWVAVLLGFCFINIFSLVGIVAQRMGVSVATVSMKLAFVLPVLIAVFLYDEPMNLPKFAGIIAALFAVVLTSVKDQSSEKGLSFSYMLLPFIIFAGSGVCDSVTQYIRHHVPAGVEATSFVIASLFSAFFFGALGLLHIWRKSFDFNYKNVIAGLVLGLPNYGSFYFVVVALKKSAFTDVQFFPINNLAIVLTATLVSVLFFKEKLSKKNVAGVLFALVSIVLIAIS